MSTAPASVGVWAAHRDDVRTRIVDAYLDLLANDNSPSMPAVAAGAGISVRTLYRYFASREDLQQYAAGWLDRRVLADMDAIERPSMREYIQRMWREFASAMPAVHAQHSTVEGRQMRMARLPMARTRIERRLPPTIEGERRAEVVDLVVAILSSSMFIELVDRMGHTPAAAADLAVDVVQLIIEHEGRTPGPTEGAP
jgi:AcrR family transcriptional regulator